MIYMRIACNETIAKFASLNEDSKSLGRGRKKAKKERKRQLRVSHDQNKICLNHKT
jgi:hypothetical protein